MQIHSHQTFAQISMYFWLFCIVCLFIIPLVSLLFAAYQYAGPWGYGIAILFGIFGSILVVDMTDQGAL